MSPFDDAPLRRAPLQLEGNVDRRDEIIEQLRDENASLRHQVASLKSDLGSVRQENSRATAALRRQLSPLYQALQQVFGELDIIGTPDSPSLADPRKVAVWESWKTKLGGGKPAELIDALLQHGEMNAVQLRVAMHCHINTVYETTGKLLKLGILSKNGGKYSLREL